MKNNKVKEKESYNQTLRQACCETNMEFDKQILTISATLFGIITTFFVTSSEPGNFKILLITMILFLITIGSCLMILKKNSDFLVALYNEKDTDKSGRFLKFLDWVKICFFIFGILSLTIFAISIIL